MLALVERYFETIRQSRIDVDIIDVLRDLADGFGFRSGYLIEYSEDLSTALHVLDSNASRRGWWKDYMARGLRASTEVISEMLGRGGVLAFSSARFTDPDDPMLAFARQYDMVECTLLPISHDGKLVGVAGFCGAATLDLRQESALQLLVYALFAQVRTFRNIGVVTQADPLTPREKEVIALSADGLTSNEIASQLGMSARTFNQHVDNVANKLGTKNRAHTVAEVIRHHML